MKANRSISIIFFGLLLVLTFQNCAKSSSSEAGEAGTNTATALAYTYDYVNTYIITPKCFNCHNSGLAFGGLNVTTYQQTMEFVIPGDPENSPLYNRVFRTKTFTLTQEERTALYTWILNGAKNDY